MIGRKVRVIAGDLSRRLNVVSGVQLVTTVFDQGSDSLRCRFNVKLETNDAITMRERLLRTSRTGSKTDSSGRQAEGVAMPMKDCEFFGHAGKETHGFIV